VDTTLQVSIPLTTNQLVEVVEQLLSTEGNAIKELLSEDTTSKKMILEYL
jgi:hypothetical protein